MNSVFLKDLVTQIILHSTLGVVVYYLTKYMSFINSAEKDKNSRSSALWAVLSVFFTYILVALLFSNGGSQEGSDSDFYQRFNFNSIISILLSYLFVLSPSLIILRFRKERIETVGVSKLNIRNSFYVGIIISIVGFFCLIPFADQGINYYLSKLNINLLWGFIYFAVVGFSEEFLFRGYLQSRLMVWIGNQKGWIIASIIMALVHIPQRIAMQGMLNTEALLSSITLIPVSLLHGYIMMKTKNLVAPGLVHTFANWYNIIFS